MLTFTMRQMCRQYKWKPEVPDRSSTADRSILQLGARQGFAIPSRIPTGPGPSSGAPAYRCRTGANMRAHYRPPAGSPTLRYEAKPSGCRRQPGRLSTPPGATTLESDAQLLRNDRSETRPPRVRAIGRTTTRTDRPSHLRLTEPCPPKNTLVLTRTRQTLWPFVRHAGRLPPLALSRSDRSAAWRRD